jgi:ribosomal protein S18 acetylase RimI-like enzyme
VIRRVDTEDWEKLRDVRLRALATDPGAFLETHAEASAFSREHWRQRATPSESQAAFLLEDAGMVGCFVADDPRVVFLVGMWVAPERRGTGAARELVDHVLEWARAHNAERVALSVEGDNDRAARLYEKCGFVETLEPPPFPYAPNPGNRFYIFEL